MKVLLKKFCCTCLLGLLSPAFLFAQKELKRYDRARAADVSYTKLGFGEVNRQLLTEKQAREINRRIQQIQADYGAVIIPVSLIAEEVADWENGGSRGLPIHFVGEDPRAARNHVTILFSEENGKNWLRYGSDNAPEFTARSQKLGQLFASTYRQSNAYRPLRRLLKQVDRTYARLPAERKNALRHPQLSASEWVDLARAQMDIDEDYASAAGHLEKAIKLDSVHAEAYMLLGYARLELQEWDAAAAAWATSWSLDADFETALGRLTLHYLRNEPVKREAWTGRVRRFSPDFEEGVYEAAHYPGKGWFIGNAARKVFYKLFREEIQQSQSEKLPEAEAH